MNFLMKKNVFIRWSHLCSHNRENSNQELIKGAIIFSLPSKQRFHIWSVIKTAWELLKIFFMAYLLRSNPWSVSQNARNKNSNPSRRWTPYKSLPSPIRLSFLHPHNFSSLKKKTNYQKTWMKPYERRFQCLTDTWLMDSQKWQN